MSRPEYVGNVDAAIAFVADKLAMPPDDFAPCVASAIYLDGRLIAGIVYHQYKPSPHGGMIEASLASDGGKRWATRATLRDMFHYPFRQLGVSRLQVMCARGNHLARKMNRQFGFVFEGVARRGWDGIEDAFLFSMLPEECKWA